MAFYKCKNKNCKFEDFLNLQIENDKYFVDDDKSSTCIFHSKEEQLLDKEGFLSILDIYIQDTHSNNKKVSFEDISFVHFKINNKIVYRATCKFNHKEVASFLFR